MSEILCIIPGPNKWEPWHPTLEGKSWGPRVLVWVDCCNRNEEAHRTEERWSIEPEESWYDPSVERRCLPGLGCNKNPNYRRTAHLRENWDFVESE